MRPVNVFARVFLVAIAAATLVSQVAAQPKTSVRVTSPLGRTGLSGPIRIVAQVVTPAPDGMVPVRFFVDNVLLGQDVDGAPYFVEWIDENPYEAREIRAEVDDDATVVSDKVTLEPLELIEETQVASVLVEAAVSTAPAGRSSRSRPETLRSSKTTPNKRSISFNCRPCRRSSPCSSTAARACRGGSIWCARRRGG